MKLFAISVCSLLVHVKFWQQMALSGYVLGRPPFWGGTTANYFSEIQDEILVIYSNEIWVLYSNDRVV